MANDTRLYEGSLGEPGLYTGDYARLENGVIRVRGSRYKDYDVNSFGPEGARRLARYILELADDAEGVAQGEPETAEHAAAKAVSRFFDALKDQGFGPELTQKITIQAAKPIAEKVLYDA